MNKGSAPDLLEAARRAYFANDWAAQERHALAALRALQDGSSEHERAIALHHLGLALYHRNAADDARAAYIRAIDLYQKLDDPLSVAFVRVSLGSVELDLRGDSAAARTLYEQAIPILREAQRELPLGISLGNMAEALRMEGDYVAALEYANEALRCFESIRDTDHAGWQLVTKANCLTLSRRYEDAFASLHEAYAEIAKAANPRWFAHYFDAWLMLLVNLRRWRRAAMLAGFLDRYRHDNRVPRLAGLEAWYRLSMTQVERNLDPLELFDLRMKGAALSFSEAQALISVQPD